MKMIPGMNKIDDGMLKQGEQQLKKIEAMIGSMTEAERQLPQLLASQPSRRRRIAAGSGHTPADVDKVLADFQKMRGFMQQMSRGGGMPGLPGMGTFYGPAGWGKTTAGIYVTNRLNAVHIEALPFGGIRSLLVMIVTELGQRPLRSLDDLFAQASGELARSARPLILDEADHLLSNRMIETIRRLHEDNRGLATVGRSLQRHLELLAADTATAPARLEGLVARHGHATGAVRHHDARVRGGAAAPVGRDGGARARVPRAQARALVAVEPDGAGRGGARIRRRARVAVRVCRLPARVVRVGGRRARG
jgi:hypothetical protein